MPEGKEGRGGAEAIQRKGFFAAIHSSGDIMRIRPGGSGDSTLNYRPLTPLPFCCGPRNRRAWEFRGQYID